MIKIFKRVKQVFKLNKELKEENRVLKEVIMKANLQSDLISLLPISVSDVFASSEAIIYTRKRKFVFESACNTIKLLDVSSKQSIYSFLRMITYLKFPEIEARNFIALFFGFLGYNEIDMALMELEFQRELKKWN